MPTAESVRRYALPLVLGAVSVAGFAPLGWFPLVVLTLGSLYALLGRLADARRTLREAALSGWFFGLGFFLVGVSWIFVSLKNGRPIAVPDEVRNAFPVLPTEEAALAACQSAKTVSAT